MHSISNSVKRNDAADKISGKAEYISDIFPDDMLNIALCTAAVQHAVIKKITLPSLPDNYTVVDKNDFPHSNKATIVAQDWPFFAEDEILYFGQPILAVAGPSLEVCERLCADVDVEYEELESVSIIEDSVEFFNDYTIVKGNPDAAFMQADRVLENTYRTGMQEQAYMEPQGMIADFKNGKLTVWGSMQCPYYIKTSLQNAFGFSEDRIRVVQITTGGAFGGKEDYPSVIAGHTAAAAVKTGRSVKMVLDRRQDMMLTPKRHPSLIKIKTALDSDGNITAMDIDCRIDAGAYQSLSGVVLERAIFICTGAYNIENIHVRGRTMKTNHIPSGAFRGFGGPQALFAADMNMEFIARETGTQPLKLREKYLFKKGDHSVTSGTFRDDIKLDEMIEKITTSADYRRKWSEYENTDSEASSAQPFKGIGISFAAHGGAFTGSGEQDIIKSVVRLEARKTAETKNGSDDYKVTLLVSNVEMGQGASLTLRKIVAETMKLPLHKVIFHQPDTDLVPDSGPTVASRTIMIVGKLLQDAAADLKTAIRTKGFSPDGGLTAEKKYVHPEEFKWNEETFTGDAYPGYSWSVNVVEVEVDRLTYEITVTGSWGIYDVGTPIDMTVLKGQMQGGTTQSLGYSGIENMQMINGKPAQASFTDYTIPTTLDFPDTECLFVDNPYRYGPYGAKAAGELPNEGPAAAFVSAVSQAVGKIVARIPVTPEHLEELLNET